MTYRIYSPTYLGGAQRDSLRGFFSDEELDTLREDGVLRMQCPCCTKPVVVRWGDDQLTAEDLGYLGVTPS